MMLYLILSLTAVNVCFIEGYLSNSKSNEKIYKSHKFIREYYKSGIQNLLLLITQKNTKSETSNFLSHLETL